MPDINEEQKKASTRRDEIVELLKKLVENSTKANAKSDKPKAEKPKKEVKGGSVWDSLKELVNSARNFSNSSSGGNALSNVKNLYQSARNATKAIGERSGGKAGGNVGKLSKVLGNVGKGGGTAEEAGSAARGAGAAARAGTAATGGAEAGGAAAGGAGEIAAGVGRLAAMAGPIGIVVAAVVAVGVALVALPFLIKGWGESLLNSQKQLAEASGGMANVFAKKEVADTMRDMRVGDATAGSAGGLSDALIKLEDRIEPFTIIVTNFLNNVMTGFVDFATAILDKIIDGINTIIKGINKMIPGADVLKQIERHVRRPDETTDLSKVMKEWSDAGKAYHDGPARGGRGPIVAGLGGPGV